MEDRTRALLTTLRAAFIMAAKAIEKYLHDSEMATTQPDSTAEIVTEN